MIPAFRGVGFVEHAISSAWQQTLPPLEVIVVDDGSPDDTARVASQWGATVIRQTNQGVTAARNAGIRVAEGEWIALLDQDDVWLPTKLQRQAEAAQLAPEVACVVTDFYRQKGGQRSALTCLASPAYSLDAFSSTKIDRDVFLLDKAGVQFFRTGFFMFPSSVLVRKDVLVEVGMFRPSLRLCEDVDCFLRVLSKTPLAVVCDPLWIWTEHDQNHSKDTIGICEGFLQMVEFIRDEPGLYPERMLTLIQPALRKTRRSLVESYASLDDFVNARRVARTLLASSPSGKDLLYIAALELPPILLKSVRGARRAIRALNS